MARKQLIINMAANGLSFAVQFCISFFLTPYIVRTLGSEAYGFIPLVNNLIGYATILTVALNSMTARFVTLAKEQRNVKQANEYFNSVLVADTVLAVVLAVVGAGIVLSVNRVFNVPLRLLVDVQMTFAFAFLGFVVSIIFSAFGCCFYVSNRVDVSARLGIESNLLRGAVLVVMFLLFVPKVWYITFTSLCVYGFLAISNIRYCRRLMPMIDVNFRMFDWRSAKEMLSAGIWNSISQLSASLLTGVDLILANMLLGASLSGQYSLVKTVPNFILQLVIAVLGAFVPEFNILYARQKEKDLLDSIDFSIRVMSLLVTVPIGFLMVFGEDFFSTWVPTQDASFLQKLSILTLIPMIVMCSTQSLNKVYTVVNKLRIPSLFFVAMGVLNVLLAWGLLRFTPLGLWALPIASATINLIIDLGFNVIYAARCLHLPWYTFYKTVMRSVLCVLTVVALSLIYRTICGPAIGWLRLVIAGIIVSSCALVINLFLVFNAQDRKKIIEKVMGKLMHKTRLL